MAGRGEIMEDGKISEEILNINILPTRECNLRCSYCKIWKSDIKALSWEEWKPIVKHLWDLSGGFISFAGGETLLTPGDIVDFTRFLEKHDIYYAYVSNSTLLTKELADKLVDAGLRNWSVSIDSLRSCIDASITKKSSVGYYWLKYFQSKGVKDLMGITVITKSNLNEITDLVKFLSEQKIWLTVTLLDFPRGKYYDFANQVPIEIPPEEEVRKLCNQLYQMKLNGYLLHDPPYYYEILPNYVTKPYFCKKPWGSLTIDADGRLRLCYRIRGVKLPQYSALDIGSKDKEILEAYRYDYKHLCSGCSWECVIHSDYWILNGKIDKGKEEFQHRRWLDEISKGSN